MGRSLGNRGQGAGLRGGGAGEGQGDLVGAEPGPGAPAGAASLTARASFCLPCWPATQGRMGRVRSHRWPPWSATRASPSGTVRTCLARLEAEGIIQSCDPDIIAARIKRRPGAEGRAAAPSPGRRRPHRRRGGGAGAPVPRPDRQGRGGRDPDDREVTGGVGSPHPAGVGITGLTRCSRCTRSRHQRNRRGAVGAATGQGDPSKPWRCRRAWARQALASARSACRCPRRINPMRHEGGAHTPAVRRPAESWHWPPMPPISGLSVSRFVCAGA
jgi:hypothetical protein